jgi:hypothetical protein
MSVPVINASGIQIETYDQVVTDITYGNTSSPGLVNIYGSDINLDPNTPDGQWLNIFALCKIDMEQFAVSIYNSFDVTQAIGTQLDALVQLNGLFRKGGTYTQSQVNITTNQTVNLNGLDNTVATPFTISDSNGNLFYLITTTSLTNGVNTLNFQAANIGVVQVVQNTLTVIVTPQQGVLAANNPNVPYNDGASQETDAQLRARQQQSTAGISTHKAMSLYAALSQLVGVEQAVVYENNTASTNSLGIGAHTIWVIVEGGTQTEIADTIYSYISDGVGMKGSNQVSITQMDGTTFYVYYDTAVGEPLYITLNIESLTSSFIDNAAIKTYIAENYILGINEEASITALSALIYAYNPTLLVTAAAVSKDNSIFLNSVFPPAVSNFFVVETTNITITNT